MTEEEVKNLKVGDVVSFKLNPHLRTYYGIIIEDGTLRMRKGVGECEMEERYNPSFERKRPENLEEYRLIRRNSDMWRLVHLYRNKTDSVKEMQKQLQKEHKERLDYRKEQAEKYQRATQELIEEFEQKLKDLTKTFEW